ncbi:MAG: hypothetical protein C4B58_02125 [Deltaproteobacteria bacterium]|nr:MAG: hypothetical protein C4B58_02125 [Deltaproteobacteria bacterium]
MKHWSFIPDHRILPLIKVTLRILHGFNCPESNFQEHTLSAELSIRAWAPILNFAPSIPITIKRHEGLQNPAEQLNQFRYHENWLQNP